MATTKVKCNTSSCKKIAGDLPPLHSMLLLKIWENKIAFLTLLALFSTSNDSASHSFCVQASCNRHLPSEIPSPERCFPFVYLPTELHIVGILDHQFALKICITPQKCTWSEPSCFCLVTPFLTLCKRVESVVLGPLILWQCGELVWQCGDIKIQGTVMLQEGGMQKQCGEKNESWQTVRPFGLTVCLCSV